MSNVKNAFKDSKAFIPFITCGDPDIQTTEKIILEMVENGADLIEIGIPFSDPTAEGDTIQAANLRAKDIATKHVFEMVYKVRKKSNIPLAFMTYANVVFSYDSKKFLQESKDLNMDALILPDVPFEEKNEFSSLCVQNNIDLISFIAPTSRQRIEMIAKEAKGFIYCVSSLGVTGVRDNIDSNIKALVDEIKLYSNTPVAIGFGIATPAQARQLAPYADGIIVGSAIVKMCEQYGRESAKHIGAFTKEMKKAISL